MVRWEATRAPLTIILLVVVVWLTVFLCIGSEGLPGGNIFGILLTVALADVVGHLVTLINLPPLVGMLIVSVVVLSPLPPLPSWKFVFPLLFRRLAFALATYLELRQLGEALIRSGHL